MLNHWLNITATQLSLKPNTYIVQVLKTKRQRFIYKLFYGYKNILTDFVLQYSVNVNLLRLFVPYGASVKQIFLYKMYIEYLNKTYKFLRILYNLPIRKTRTHSRSKKKKWLYTLAVSYCMKTIPLFRQLKLPQSKIQIMFFCEFINSVWFYNWWGDWFSAYKTRIKSITKNPFIKWRYDVTGLQQGRAVFFTTKKKKTKHNRRKALVLKNTYNIGFHYGFSLTHLKKIFAVDKKK